MKWQFSWWCKIVSAEIHIIQTDKYINQQGAFLHQFAMILMILIVLVEQHVYVFDALEGEHSPDHKIYYFLHQPNHQPIVSTTTNYHIRL